MTVRSTLFLVCYIISSFSSISFDYRKRCQFSSWCSEMLQPSNLWKFWTCNSWLG
jgi:hypothetical protein